VVITSHKRSPLIQVCLLSVLNIGLLLGCVARQQESPLFLSQSSPKQKLIQQLSLGLLKPESGMAQAIARIKIKDTTSFSPFKLLALPTRWQSARVTLHSTTANGLFTESINARVIPSASFSSSGGFQVATVVFPPLRPSTDYRAEISLTNTTGTIVTARLGGSQSQTVTLNGGANNIDFIVDVNGQEAMYGVSGNTSTNNNIINEMYQTSYYAGAAYTSGSADGDRLTAARFDTPYAIYYHSNGNLYISDRNGIRQITPAGIVSTLSTYTLRANYEFGGIAEMSNGDLILASENGNCIKRLTLGGVLTHYAGSTTNITGHVNSLTDANDARFLEPSGIAVDPSDNVYVSEYNNTIRKITPGNLSTDRDVLTLQTNGTFSTSTPGFNKSNGEDLKVLNGFLYFATGSAGTVLKLDLLAPAPPTVLTTGLGYSLGLTQTPQGSFIATDYSGHKIYKLTSLGVSTVIAGSVSGAAGMVNGIGTDSRFDRPHKVTSDPAGNLYVAELQHTIRKLQYIGPTLTKDDAFALNTGIAANQPGVDKVELFISGAAYGNPGSPVLIKRFTNASAATWNTYTWDTSVANIADGANYSPSSFVGGAGQSKLAGQIDVKAYDRYGVVIGTGSFNINVQGRPTTTIRIQ
jgi:hypothetical protein